MSSFQIFLGKKAGGSLAIEYRVIQIFSFVLGPIGEYSLCPCVHVEQGGAGK